MRAILFLGLVLVVFFAIRYLINSFKVKPNEATTRSGSGDSANETSQQSEKIVACEHCQLHIPLSQAQISDGKYFCSQQHLEDFSSK